MPYTHLRASRCLRTLNYSSNLSQKSNVSMAFSGIIMLLFPRGKLESNFYPIHLYFPWTASQYREFEVQEMLIWVISLNIYDIR